MSFHCGYFSLNNRKTMHLVNKLVSNLVLCSTNTACFDRVTELIKHENANEKAKKYIYEFQTVC